MLNVFLTVDTEISSFRRTWHDGELADAMARDIFGKTSTGEFGLRYQIQVLNSYGLKAVFFVEALFADAVGLERLREIVRTVAAGGHEVQLHLHSEWLAVTPSPVLPGRTGSNMKDFSEDEQNALIARGVQNLQACGIAEVRAFRAGNYGANFDTLRALSRNGILYDTSYNIYYLGTPCGLSTRVPLVEPVPLCGIHEFPISFFRDWPGHYRHTQLTSCSSSELAGALLSAWRQRWYSFVIVSHSFELLNGQRRRAGIGVPDRVAIARFEKLCQLLARHRDKFRTCVFSEIEPSAIPPPAGPQPLSSPLYRTAWRYAEQLSRRLS